MSGAVVFGGYGTFGRRVAAELARAGVAVTIAGRDRRRAEAAAQSLGPGHRGLALSLTATDDCRAALQGQSVAVNCARPLDDGSAAFLDVCVETGCHYVDIAVERPHAALVRGRSEQFRQAGLTAAYGCSSLPAISGALGLLAHAAAAVPPDRARVTLLIGNDNPKGAGAIHSLLRLLGTPIQAPQGLLFGFRDREMVSLPAPFGRRAAFNFDSPEYDLFPELLGVRAVAVKVAFELRPATYGFALLALSGLELGSRAAGILARIGRLLPRTGSSGGVVLTELFYADGTVRGASLLARREGQRMAALPCALVARALCRGEVRATGGVTAYEFFGAEELLGQLANEGFEVKRRAIKKVGPR